MALKHIRSPSGKQIHGILKFFGGHAPEHPSDGPMCPETAMG